MKRAWLTVFVALVMSSPAVSATFTLSALVSITGIPSQDAPWPYAGMVTWTSPGAGSVIITGSAWSASSTDPVTVEYIPASLPSNYTPGKKLVSDLNPDTVLQAGTTPLLGGTVQYGAGGQYYESQADPAAFATSASIPCSGSVSWCSGYKMPLNPIAVQAGDVIAVLITNGNILHGDMAGVNLYTQFSGDFQQQGAPGSLTAPDLLTGLYTGIAGNLDTSSDHSSDAYEFSWAGGDFSGAAATDLIFQNGLGTGGFLDGLELELYSSSGSPLGTRIVLGSSSTSTSFDFGSLPQGNYVLQVVDMSSLDDPPYSLEFNGSVGAPAPTGGSVPEPGTALLLCAGLAGLAVRRACKVR